VNSPPLLADTRAVSNSNLRKLTGWPLQPEQVDSDHLDAFLKERPTQRVGRYFERLVLYWLRHVRQVEVVAESLQVRDGKRTIGEIDLLFYDEQRHLTHWEIAVKFYLHFPQDTTMGSHYIGPNAADTLERKTKRLFEHQLPRSKRDFSEVTIRQAFVKGRIFYHPLQALPSEQAKQLAANHLRRTWIRSTQLNQIQDTDGEAYLILRKPFWLSSEVAGVSDVEWMSKRTLVDVLAGHFAEHDHPVLVSQLRTDGQKFVESKRIFVVPKRWPDRESVG